MRPQESHEGAAASHRDLCPVFVSSFLRKQNAVPPDVWPFLKPMPPAAEHSFELSNAGGGLMTDKHNRSDYVSDFRLF